MQVRQQTWMKMSQISGSEEKRSFFLMLNDLLVEITSIEIIHHDAKQSSAFGFEPDEAHHSELEASSIKASLYATTLTVLIDASMRTSLSAFCFSFSDSLLIFTFLSAYDCPSDSLFTL